MTAASLRSAAAEVLRRWCEGDDPYGGRRATMGRALEDLAEALEADQPVAWVLRTREDPPRYVVHDLRRSTITLDEQYLNATQFHVRGQATGFAARYWPDRPIDPVPVYLGEPEPMTEREPCPDPEPVE